MPLEDVPPDTGSPQKYFNLLVVDGSPGERRFAKDYVEKYLKSSHPELTLKFYEASTPNQGLELLSQAPVDMTIFDIEFYPIKTDPTRGLTDFLIPARKQGYEGTAICWAERVYKDLAMACGANRFFAKENGDYKALPEVVKEILSSRQEAIEEVREPEPVLA